MFLTLFYPFIKFTLGTLYPAYKTWKSLGRKDETIRRRWMKYWVSFSVFQTVEYFADLTVAFVMPFYIEFKISALMWLVHMRASSLIDSAVDKELKKREKNIDKWLKRINNEFIGVAWYEISRCSIKVLAILLKSIAASHHINLSDVSPMQIDNDCDISNNENNNQNSSNNSNDQTITENNNYQLEYNVGEDMNDTTSMNTRKLRVKRERAVIMESEEVD